MPAQIETRQLSAEERDWLLRHATPRPVLHDVERGHVVIAVLAGALAGMILGPGIMLALRWLFG